MIRHFRFAFVLLAIGVVAAGLSLALVRLPFLGLADQWLADFRIAALSAPEPQNEDIVIVTVTEDTLAQFPYRSPLDRGFIRDVLLTLEERGVRAIAMDILIDQPTEAAKDAALKATIEGLTVPFYAAYAGTAEGLTESQSKYLDAFLAPRLRAFANLIKDAISDTVRWIYPGRTLAQGVHVRGFAGALADRLGHPAPDTLVPVYWRAAPNDEKPAFRSFPAQALKFLPPAWFKDKVVLIGADLGIEDRHRTPFAALGKPEGRVSGVIVHAHAVAQLLDNRRPIELGPWGRILVIALVAASGIALAFVDVNLAARLGVTIASLALLLVGALAVYRYGQILVPAIEPALALIAGLWMTDAYRGRSERLQKRFIKDAFAKYLSPTLVDRLVEDPSALALGGENREMSYIFTDIAGFTTLSENAGAEAVSTLLNQYLSGACEIVFAHGGTVTDFIGDAVFAMFNAPLHQDDHAARALACASDLDAFCESFRGEEMGRKLGLGITRIGVHTGPAAVGNMGADTHFKYSPIGDAVNTAARIEGLNKHFGTRFCASAATLKHCPEAAARPLGQVVMKGKTEPLEIFEILDAERDRSPYMEEYRRAYAMLDTGDEGAKALFAKLRAENPDDATVALHLARIEDGAKDALVIMESK
ncbi:MAG: adenylate/guanylate cyclase domain-containing protein [Rhodospirillales bacterium]|jgi:class 3 adenylate cyclase/CHASE2 domain-containing sensor protein|nr:adenylate/guanylate cyclase domain-containing protein [Rhodospirillales bacterium]MDP6883223.1 adenylate/guanylate cyclase domain-containing protein [Rhodospirillales bacterium]